MPSKNLFVSGNVPSSKFPFRSSNNKTKSCTVSGPRMDRKTQHTCIKGKNYIYPSFVVQNSTDRLFVQWGRWGGVYTDMNLVDS